MKCPHCDATIQPGKRFCTACGHYLSKEIRNAVDEPEQTPSTENAPANDMPAENGAVPEVTADAAAVNPAQASAPESDAQPVADPEPIPEESVEDKPAAAAEPEAETVPDDAANAADAAPEAGSAPSEATPAPEDAHAENKENAPAEPKHISVMPTDPNKPATADLMIPVGPDPKPEKNSQWAPVGTWGWLGIRLVMLVPILNIVLLLVWSFGGTRKNVKQSWARATLVWVLLIMILMLGAVLYILLHPSLALSIVNAL